MQWDLNPRAKLRRALRRTIVAAPARMQTIRVETNGGRIHGVEVDGHRLRGVVDITIGDKSGTNPPAIFIQLRGRLEFAEADARAIQSSFIPKNGTV